MNEPSRLPNSAEAKAAHIRVEVATLNSIVHKVLLVGLGISTFLMVFGIVLQIISGSPMPDIMTPPYMIAAGLAAFQPASFFTLGLLCLIATPILRVVGSVLIYAYERDWRYTLATFVVLMIVIVSLIVGAG